MNPGEVIESFAVAQAMREHDWLYPTVAIACGRLIARP